MQPIPGMIVKLLIIVLGTASFYRMRIQSDLVNPDPFVPGGFVRIREMYGLTSKVYVQNRKSVP